MIFDIQFVKSSEVTPSQASQLASLNAECFGDVPTVELTDNFIAEPFGYLLATIGENLVSRTALFKRDLVFAKTKIVVGGIGGVCVARDYRHHGIASSMIKRALTTLQNEGCEVACLSVDVDKKIHRLYEKLGFTLMERPISFENVRSEIIYEKGTMFHPLTSPQKYDLIMNSKETFHYGRGCW